MPHVGISRSNGQPILLPEHEKLIVDSGIRPEVAHARGYYSAIKRSDVHRHGFGWAQCLVPALVIPIWTVFGEIGLYQLRPNTPRIKNGRPLKYETPAGSLMSLDVPPTALQWVADPSRPLFITEGARKADSAVSQGLCCIALLGVWNWRGSNEENGRVALPDWELIALKKRQIYIVFDSDVMQKDQVHKALIRLKAFLGRRGAEASVVYLPPQLNGSKMGLDDFLAAGHGVVDLLDHASDEIRPIEESEPLPATTYRKTASGLVWDKSTSNGIVTVPLTNFSASITADVSEDDGAEISHVFEVEAQLNAKTHRFVIPASQFASMNWAVEQLGGQAIVRPGIGLKDHARCAIQSLSGDIAERKHYVHLGWRQIDNEWVYLNAAGAIGKTGFIEGLRVIPPGSLSLYTLPHPPEGQVRSNAVAASLRLLKTGDERILIALFASIWRASMSPVDFSIHLAGPTGVGKSELAALVQQHWGPEMNARSLPGNWSSTGNALESLAHAAKDAILTVDDFAPTGTLSDSQRLHREADRILRAQGNHSGRQRMRADSTLRPVKPPRGLILSTGEDVPKGQSLRARILVLDCAPDSINWDRLTTAQGEATQGLYAQAMSAFLCWLAGRYEYLPETLGLETRELRQLAHQSGDHRRTAQIAAELGIGLRYFLAFAQEIGVISLEDVSRLWTHAWQGLGEVSLAQQLHHIGQEPALRFISLLSAALAAGRVHIASETGDYPEAPASWGWRKKLVGRESLHEEWVGQGERVGWIKDGEVLLEPVVSHAVVQKMAHDLGESLNITPQTLRRRLKERGYLASTDEARRTITVRRVIEGNQRHVLHLNKHTLMQPPGEEADKVDIVQTSLPRTSQTNGGSVSNYKDRGESSILSEGQSGTLSCRSCGGTTFWCSIYGSRVCRACHPPATPELVEKVEEGLT